jgi:hypothetical protein
LVAASIVRIGGVVRRNWNITVLVSRRNNFLALITLALTRITTAVVVPVVATWFSSRKTDRSCDKYACCTSGNCRSESELLAGHATNLVSCV